MLRYIYLFKCKINGFSLKKRKKMHIKTSLNHELHSPRSKTVLWSTVWCCSLVRRIPKCCYPTKRLELFGFERVHLN